MSQTTNSSKVVHLVLTPWNLSDDYNRHAGATLLSLLENSSLPVIVHLLYDANESSGNENGELYNRKCYQKIADIYGCEVIFHNVEMPLWLKDVPAVKRWTPGTLMRLYVPDILPDVDKVLYLDCDIIVNLDVKELWDINLDSWILGAVVPEKHLVSRYNHDKKMRKIYQKFNIDINDYFNAGVLLLNLKSIREVTNRFTSELLELLHENPDLPYLNQDLLNIFCKGKYLHLHEKYNIFSTHGSVLEYADNAIIHYAIQEVKPWKRYSEGIDDYYWHYVVKTPWFDDGEKMLKYVRAAVDINAALHLLPLYMFSQSETNRVKKAKNILRVSLSMQLKLIISLVIQIFSKI